MFSRQNQELDQIFTYYTTSRDSLKWYLDGIMNNEVVDSLYIGYTKQELRDAFLGHIDELEKNIIFSILSSLEARFQMDYQNRVKKRYKDNFYASNNPLDLPLKGNKLFFISVIF